MIKVIAEPLVKVNGIKFGDSREEVRTKFGNPKVFRKNKLSLNSTDDYGCFHVYYDKDDYVVAVELFSEVEVWIGEKMVFPTTLANARAIVPEFSADDCGLICVEQSISIFAPGDKMESILFGKKRYFKNL